MRYVVYILKRVVSLIPVLLGISFIVFFLIRLIPGDPAATLLGVHATPQAVKELRDQMGLEKPLLSQYLTFLGHLLQGNLGFSYVYNSSVLGLIATSLPVTIWLLVSGTFFTLLIAVPLAVLAAARRNGIADNIIRAVPVVGLGLPAFLLGIALIVVFGLKLGWFPVGGYGQSLAEHVRGIVLPGITVALTLAPIVIRSLRASMIEVLSSDYIVTAHSKGISTARVVLGHALRNAAVSSVTVLGVNIAYLTGSTLVVERVFSLPGIGQQMINSIFGRDFPTVQGITLVFAIMVVVVNLLTDVAHSALDPRVQLA
ncbi:ABC transporter permease [Microbispora hainanensis]|jgi:peptide/nickel transport system permease protein|uniref:ABC transporter permease n=1 Tax=Microbispora hainanensis TaxID=568844 RepID=A0A544YP98_9ACTN|nr:MULTISPECIES: ABC transporter permease [Microbispora]NJP25311.1 ABC transporter permease [Microbispora sp. CL1-1]TQS13758.1 ABC transporter permease [Microbispora sp. SCL1-1]TQS18556.1 ABC transporter permease [Microbispora hainanensis]